MYTILATNIETLKVKGVAAKDGEVSVAVLDKDLANDKTPKLYAFRQGMVYNPADEFRPNIAGNHKLPEKLIEEFFKLLDEARNNLTKLQAKQGSKEVVKEVVKVEKDEKSMKELEELKALLKAQAVQIEELKAGKNEKIVHENFEKIVTLIEAKQAVYMYGPAGTGKSELAKQVAEKLGLDFYPASTITQEFKLTGFIDGRGEFHEMNFYKAMKYGGIFFLDEMDSCAPEVLVGINGALANGYFDFPIGTVTAHKDFRVISAGNTIGRGGDMNYTGRFALDISTLDRFWGVKLDYSPAIDKAVAKNDTQLVEFANEVRRSSQEIGVSILMSYRSISRIAEFQNMFTLKEIMEMAVIKGIDSDDIRMLISNMNMTNSNKYYKAMKEAV